ncbi:DNA replication licensing factor MCM5 [Olea europaea subsp. europaea]|uniref:DNA replication licensing factor MCM5 n=1 Tax=Olea europaea subsp. europaea TaxID=158383 RepID=A0A8S0UN60_OLEEU|nr:DNA replication licensing factor MCM5 [Olea europaea subsp. europaea]
MSGWDEGEIYYSDQAQFPPGGASSGDQANGTSRHAALQKFKELIRNFQCMTQPNVYPYREALVGDPKCLPINLTDLILRLGPNPAPTSPTETYRLPTSLNH